MRALFGLSGLMKIGLCGREHPPSCVECVEKHLGAARVLMAEVRDGYGSRRLLAVGHLHEAEDESQEWPGLHEAVRAARKGYQSEGIIPDWEALWALVVTAGGK
ncbi:MAG: hypothetical protein A3E78_13345 [Alphaproteobacteria bacterium RIFCSPHIGHO2_12_FULL_63_12]|nr:MAG: hypothetical protein A3E78_13345 [Alphaproteobacteria bacterium RIFCSPHIGHO2_12_FULL_63_12]